MDPTRIHLQLGSCDIEDAGGGGGSNNKNLISSSSYVCSRQTSSRWTPSSEQIRILKELYYNNGIRSPSAEQIQKIASRLRHYGKIEGKNVFYWFQNHKARERQKKRLTAASTFAATDHHHYHHHQQPPPPPSSLPFVYNNFTPLNFASSPVAVGMMPGGVSNFGKYGYGSSLAMENNFNESCSISQKGVQIQNFVWAAASAAGVDDHPYTTFLDEKNQYPYTSTTTYYDEMTTVDQEIETLPLFPMHGDDQEGVSGNFSNGSNVWYHQQTGVVDDENMRRGCCSRSRASLELTLNSYGSISHHPFSP